MEGLRSRDIVGDNGRGTNLLIGFVGGNRLWKVSSIDQILSAAIDWEVSIDRYCLRQWAGDESIDR